MSIGELSGVRIVAGVQTDYRGNVVASWQGGGKVFVGPSGTPVEAFVAHVKRLAEVRQDEAARKLFYEVPGELFYGFADTYLYSLLSELDEYTEEKPRPINPFGNTDDFV